MNRAELINDNVMLESAFELQDLIQALKYILGDRHIYSERQGIAVKLLQTRIAKTEPNENGLWCFNIPPRQKENMTFMLADQRHMVEEYCAPKVYLAYLKLFQ